MDTFIKTDIFAPSKILIAYPDIIFLPERERERERD